MIIIFDKTRSEVREDREEFQLVLDNYSDHYKGFLYGPSHKVETKRSSVAFGSGTEREVLPTRGSKMASIMRRCMTENLPQLGPGSYNEPRQMTKKSFSKAEVPFNSTSSRLSKPPRKSLLEHDQFYDVYQAPVRPEKKPFGVGSRRGREHFKISDVPGAGTYDVSEPKRKNIYKHSFGGPIRIKPATLTICSPVHLEKCQNCDETPYVDYWKDLKSGEIFCLRCMEHEKEKTIRHSRTKSVKIRRLQQLKEFRRVRYCGYVHQHNGTPARIRIMTPKELRNKFRRENYLSQFNL